MKRIGSAVVVPTGPNYTQSIETGGFTLLSDEPLGADGQNAGAAPCGLLLAELGSRDEDGRTFIDRTLDSDASLDGDQWLKLVDIASKTPVTKTLLAGTSITTRRAGGT